MSRDVLVIGEALVDIVHREAGRIEETPGGSPANVALALARLGDEPLLLTQLGEDPRGRAVRAWLAASGVDVLVAGAERTSTASAQLGPDGSARYEFDLSWTLDGVDPESVVGEHPGIVHVGSVAALLHPGADVVRSLLEALRPDALISYDPNIRPALVPDRAQALRDVEALVAASDVVKASDEDLGWLYPGEDPLEVAQRLQRSGPAIVVVTRGGDGADAVTAAGVVRVGGHRVDVVDTVGAGDTFMAALIHSLRDAGLSGAASREALRGVDEELVRAMLAFGAAAAAVTVSRPGADPPRLDEVAGPSEGVSPAGSRMPPLPMHDARP
ncbi:MAG: carbohydrate kinase [Microbacterium sp.]|uniref:carbohydrate kinase family protein n=1 Tax=Microbacterium sp. TaxID=51671 RepID=UPI001D726DF5|nr:carbohydrate kinase [Microbacterium sp.]MBW8761494.1 carbohydrate kinase [Microbacterium sp.]